MLHFIRTKQSRQLTESANPQVAYRLNAPGLMSNVGWFAGFIGCFKPMWMMMGKGKQQEIEKGTIIFYNSSISQVGSLSCQMENLAMTRKAPVIFLYFVFR